MFELPETQQWKFRMGQRGSYRDAYHFGCSNRLGSARIPCCTAFLLVLR